MAKKLPWVMAKKSPWYLPNQTVVALFFAIAACFVWSWARSRPIPFDSEQWKQVRMSGDFDIRYRMAEDLKAKLKNMAAPNIAAVRQLLGPPSSEVSNGRQPRPLHYYSYYIGGRSISSRSWELLLSFDENKQLTRFILSSDGNKWRIDLWELVGGDRRQ